MRRKKAAEPASPDDASIRPHTSERGEIALHLDGMDLIMRPSHEAITDFEQLTGKGLLMLTRSALDGSMTLGEVAQIATECVKAWGRSTGSSAAKGVNAQRMAELMLEGQEGFHGALKTVAGMLSLASTGGYTAQGELKAGTTMTNGVPAGNS